MKTKIKESLIKNKSNILTTIGVLIFCTLLSSYNTTKSTYVLTQTRAKQLQKLLQQQSIIFRKLKTETRYTTSTQNIINKCNVPTSTASTSTILINTKYCHQALTAVSKELSNPESFLYKEIIRNKQKLATSIVRYNEDVTLYNDHISKTLNSTIAKKFNYKTQDKITINIDQSKILISRKS